MTADSPDFSGNALITGSQPLTGAPIATVPTTVENITSIVQAAGTQSILSSNNHTFGPGATQVLQPPTATGTQVYVLDYVAFTIQSTVAAGDLEADILIAGATLNQRLSLSTGKLFYEFAYGGIIIPNTNTVEMFIINHSGTNTYAASSFTFIVRVVTL